MYLNMTEEQREITENGPRAGNSCDCDEMEREPEKFIWQGNFDEIHYLCMNCGGYVD